MRVAVLLAAILCTMVFGPAPVLILAELVAGYVALAFLGAAAGEVGAAVMGAVKRKRGPPTGVEPPARPRAAYDASIFAEWAVRNPMEAARRSGKGSLGALVDAAEVERKDARSPTLRRKPVFNLPATAYVVAAILAAWRPEIQLSMIAISWSDCGPTVVQTHPSTAPIFLRPPKTF